MFEYFCFLHMRKQRSNIELNKQIAIRLKKLREEKKFSQDDVYIDTDLNIARIEVGRTNITVSTLSILCKLYEITLEEFFKGIEMR